METPASAIETYIRAKDENRPHLLGRAFTASASVEMIVKTGVISFPPSADGIDAIADMLVRRFGQTYENVYTFCLSQPPEAGCRRFSCDWLVGMSEKQSGAGRVGYGRYDWQFAADDRYLVSKLSITIEAMQIVAPRHVAAVMRWLSSLPYPWCPVELAAKGPAEPGDLAEMLRRLASTGRGA